MIETFPGTLSSSWPRSGRKLAAAVIAAGLSACAAEPELDPETDETAQQIINGTPIPAEGTGYVFISGASGTLVRNNWVLTAAHVVSWAVNNPGAISIQMGSQSTTGSAVHLHPSMDVALVQMAAPFTMNGSTTSHEKQLYTYDAPRLVGKTLACDGYGNNTYTTGTGTLRHADLPVNNVEGSGYRLYPNSQGQIQWMNDSGSSCHQNGNITGVQSTCAHWPELQRVHSCYQEGAASFGDWALDRLGTAVGGPAAAATSNVGVYERGTDNAIWQLVWNGSWSGWYSLGGAFTSEPAAVAMPDGRWVVFGRGTDNAIWSNTWNGAWSGWSSLGGNHSSGPAATVDAQGRLWLFARGQDNAVWYRRYTTAWSPWASLGNWTASAPAAAVDRNGVLHVFARGSWGDLHVRTFNGSWQPWRTLGGVITSSPSAATDAWGNLHVFVRDASNGLHLRTFDGSSWGGWTNLGGTLISAPGAAVRAGRAHVFVRGTDGNIHYQVLDGSWSGWYFAG